MVLTSMTGCNKKEVDATTEEILSEATTEEANVIRIEEESFGVAMTLDIGDDGKLEDTSDKAVTYEGMNEDIVRVDKDGTVTAIGSGKVKIVVTDGEIRKSTFVVVKVEPYVASTEETSEETTEETTEVAENANNGGGNGNGNSGNTASNTNTSNGNTGTTASGNSGTTTPSTPSEPATESTPSEPATESTTETAKTYYYRDWDYICNRTNELLKQNFPGVIIAQEGGSQTIPDLDGYDWPLPYSDEAYAQQTYQCIANGLAGRGIYPGDTTTFTGGAFILKIENTPDYNQPNARTITIIYYN